MFLGRIKGHVVMPQQDPGLNGSKLLIVEPLKVIYDKDGGGDLEVTGRAIVTLDKIGAGEGELVLITQGSSARLSDGCGDLPIDAVVVGLVDEAVVCGKQVAKANS